jgi:probable rRNA maturation factor
VQPEGGGRRLELDWDIEEVLADRVDLSLLRSALEAALLGRMGDGPVSVGLTVTHDEGMRRINREHRGLDAPTDVLSFPLLEFDAPEQPAATFPLPPGEALPVGDIVISFERAVQQAADYGHSLAREMAFLAVHGAMHLLGYDHESPGDEARMRQEEEAVLRQLGLERSGNNGL